MGRRALRKIDPSLDLTSYLFELDDLARPLDLLRLFGRSAALEVEVGCGKGLFLSTAAGEHRERNYLGVEVARKYARYAAARLAADKLANGAVICGDAWLVFRELLPTASVAAVHVYFPDPWWKKRHRKRRVLQADFLRDVERVLQMAGKLHFWTDVQEYFESAVELIQQATTLAGPHAVPERIADHDLDYRTHFERRMRLAQSPVYRGEFHRRS